MTVIVNIDHETGDLSQYTSTVTDGGDLSVASAAALAGTSYGLSCVVDDTTAIYGEKAITANTSGVWRFRVYIDPNGLTMDALNSFDVVQWFKSASTTVRGAINLRYNSGYTVRVDALNDAFGFASTAYVAITDAPHYIEWKITRASGATANDGRIDWWIDGAVQTAVTGIDNYDQHPNLGAIRLGAVGGIDAGTSGTFYLDELVVNDTGDEIGPVVTHAAIPVYMAQYRQRVN